MSRLARFAWWTLALNVGVILWGAYVRATGSGAGCGNHWPLCNGQVVPRAPSIETLIEYSHRLTSGMALIAVVTLFWWARRALAVNHPARRAAAASLILIIAEALVGAGLVVFHLVAGDTSAARAGVMAAHLINTFLLLAALALCAHWLSTSEPQPLVFRGGHAPKVILGAVGLILVGTTGAIAALGDTLFPVGSLTAGLAADFSATSHFLLRLRVFHPVLAVAVAVSFVTASLRLPRSATDPRVRYGAAAIGTLALSQVGLGLLNMLMLAPVWLQVLHLLVADALWISYVILGACLLEADPLRRPATVVSRPSQVPGSGH